MMVAIAFSDKSRDYTIPDSSLLAVQQVPVLPAAPTVWQNSQAASMYPGNEYAAATAVHSQVSAGQAPSWNPTMQAGRSTYMQVPSTFPGQTYPASPVPAYGTAATPVGSSPLLHSSPVSPVVASVTMTQPGFHTNVRPSGASPPNQPPYYGQ